MWYAEQCDNEDSCGPGQTHLYPEPGTKVDISTATTGRVVGGKEIITIPRGIYFVGEHIDYQGHQASIIASQLVWVNIDEMFAVGTYTKDQ